MLILPFENVGHIRGVAQMTDAWAYAYDREPRLYTSDDSTQLTMMSGSDVLSTVAPVSATSLSFTWHDSN